MIEPIYDNDTIACMVNEQRKDLVRQLWQYTLALEDYIINLRNQVNSLSDSQKLNKPFPDPASDFIIRFSDHPAFSEFAGIMIDEVPDFKITDY